MMVLLVIVFPMLLKLPGMGLVNAIVILLFSRIGDYIYSCKRKENVIFS